MAAAVGTMVILDGNTVSRNMQVLDLSGVGSGPYTFLHNIVDASGVNLLAVDSSGRLTTKLNDGSGNSISSTSNALNVNISSQTGLTNIGVNLAQVAGATVATGHGTAAGAIRVELPTDGTGVLATVGTVTTVSTVSASRTVGNAGAVLDGVNTAATAPANGILGLGIYNSTEPSPTTGQSVGIQLDAKGRQRGVIMDAAGNTRGANVNSSNQLSVSVDNSNVSTNIAQINGVTPLMGNGVTGTGSPRMTLSSDNTAIAGWGLGATGSAVPSGAQYNGLQAITALPTAGSNGNMVGASGDKYGRSVGIVGTIRDLVGTQATTITSSTSETTIVTQAASVFNDIVLLVLSNTSTATNVRVDFRDTSAGSVLFSLQSNGGQPPTGFATSRPLPQTTVNTNWTAQCSAVVTDLRIYAVFEKNK